jgi:ATP-dependent Lon protease
MKKDPPKLDVYPLIPLRGLVIYPGMSVPLSIGRRPSLSALQAALASNLQIVLLAQHEAGMADVTPDDLYKVGVVCQVRAGSTAPEFVPQTIVAQALWRCEVKEFVATEPHFQVKVHCLQDEDDPAPAALVESVKNLLETVYATALTVHLVLDNLNTHFRQTFVDVLGETAAVAVLQRVQFHYTPRHASWLNMAEIEIGIMERQCTGQRIGTAELLQAVSDSGRVSC